MVIPYRRFGTTYRPSKMEPTDCPETSARLYPRCYLISQGSAAHNFFLSSFFTYFDPPTPGDRNLTDRTTSERIPWASLNSFHSAVQNVLVLRRATEKIITVNTKALHRTWWVRSLIHSPCLYILILTATKGPLYSVYVCVCMYIYTHI